MTDINPLELMAEAMAASRRGDSAVAVERLRVLARQPGVSGEPLLLLAAELVTSGQVEEAESAFAEAILRSPHLSIARFQLGLLQVTTGRHALGTLTWQPLLQLPLEDALHHYVDGYVALINDEFDRAMKAFERGLSLPQQNEALMEDVRKTVAKISSVSLETAGEVQVTGTDAAEHHVLLSNYSADQRRH